MSTDWLGPRMYRPSLEELLRGALAPWNPEVHYITTLPLPEARRFPLVPQRVPDDGRHPARARGGGGRSARNGRLRFAERQDRRLRRVGVVGAAARSDPDGGGRAAGRCRAAARRLACSTCVLVNVGVDRAELSEGQITYVYDEDLPSRA